MTRATMARWNLVVFSRERYMKAALLALLAIVQTTHAAEIADLEHWDPQSSPATIGTKLTERFIASDHIDGGADYHFPVYQEVITWYGALAFTAEANNPKFTEALVARFEPFFLPENQWHLPPINHVDA